MTDLDPLKLSPEAIGRQAVRSIGGYLYQLYQSLLAWLNLGETDILLLEVAEDHAVLRETLVSQTQVKDDKASSNITLRSESIVSLINSHWDLQRSNPHRAVYSALLTTAAIGTEQQLPFPNRMSGLEYWRVAARNDSDLKPLRDALLAINIKEEIKAFISSASDEDLRIFCYEQAIVNQFRHHTSQPVWVFQSPISL